MTNRDGLVYEVSLAFDREIADEFDRWLEQQLADMLEIPGVDGAKTFLMEPDESSRAARVVHFSVESGKALEDFPGGAIQAMQRDAVLRFAGRSSASHRVLYRNTTVVATPQLEDACLNCEAPLQGQYCARCGQRARGRLISMWELVRDAVGDLFELDSRLWRTLIPLMCRPGKLTREYLIGRRARFMPPFRTYLVLSVIFFLVAFFDPAQQLNILYEPPSPGATLSETSPDAERRREVLAGSGNIDCNFSDFEMSGPDWLTRRLTRERLQLVCEKTRGDGGRAFVNQLLDNIPAALFVLLPLMAFVLKVLYPLARRYYAEHLLFVLHFHAFFFLILTLEILFSRFVRVVNLPDLMNNLSVFAVSLYVPLYLYRAMRRVYAQGRAITILKYFILLLTYLVGTVLILLVAAFYTAFSI